MKVFVAGATGVLGRRAVQRLVQSGHEVSGVARGTEKAALLGQLGASPVAVDIFDARAAAAAVAGHDVVCNLATAIPPVWRSAVPGAWTETARIRRYASRVLVEAAVSAGADRFVQESITFPYVDRGAEWIDEDTRFRPPRIIRAVLEAEAHAARFGEAGRASVVLRFAQFHAPESSHTRSAVSLLRRGFAPAVGRPEGYVSIVEAGDAASAVVAALGAPSGVYNVCDDEPLIRREYADTAARALGAKAPRFFPRALTALGGGGLRMLMRSQRVANERLKQATGWAPGHPSARETWAAIAAAIA